MLSNHFILLLLLFVVTGQRNSLKSFLEEMTNPVAREPFKSVVTCDDHWNIDKEKMNSLYAKKPRPWLAEPKYFNKVYLSALAALKMVMHAKTGQGKRGIISSDKSNWIEVMGLMQGHFSENTLIVTDSFGLPVDASEVECSMNQESQDYMLGYLEYMKNLGRIEGCVGWYHSHPGYSCFLSGIDVNTQRNNQMIYDPWVAVVVDPVQTIATGKIELKAFRTLPSSAEGQASSSAASAIDTSTIPADKIKELGVYFNQYYELPVTIVRSKNDAAQLDMLWSKFWVNELSSSPLVASRHFTTTQIRSLTSKISAEKGSESYTSSHRESNSATARDDSIKKCSKALCCEALQGLASNCIKEGIFQ